MTETETLQDQEVAPLITVQDIDEMFKEIAPRALASYDQVGAAIDAKKLEIAELEHSRKRLADALKLAGHDVSATKKKSTAKDPTPSPESVAKVVRWLAEQPEPRSYAEIGEALSLSNSTVNKQVMVGRNVELIALARMGGEKGRLMLFSAIPGAIERLDAGTVQWP